MSSGFYCSGLEDVLATHATLGKWYIFAGSMLKQETDLDRRQVSQTFTNLIYLQFYKIFPPKLFSEHTVSLISKFIKGSFI